MIDERLIKALHVETLRKQDLHAEHEPHVIFQTSTIDALLDGAYDAEVTFAELRDHGDHGLGTFEACDGEMIAVDGAFFRAAGTRAYYTKNVRTENISTTHYLSHRGDDRDALSFGRTG